MNRGQVIPRCGLAIAALEAERDAIDESLLEARKLRAEIQSQEGDPTPEQRARAARVRVPMGEIVDLVLARRA